MSANLEDFISLARPQKYGTFISVVAGFAAVVPASDLSSRFPRLVIVFCSFAVLFYTGVYILNDLGDRKRDMQHPTKMLRPIASGHICARAALLTGVILVLSGIAVGTFAGSRLVVFQICFLGVNLLYIQLLKALPVVELIGNTVTHPMRALMGVMLFGHVSWEVAPVIASSALVYWAANCLKRHLELSLSQLTARPVLRHYTTRLLAISAALPGLILVGLLFVARGLSMQAIVAFALVMWMVTYLGYFFGPSWLRSLVIASLAG